MPPNTRRRAAISPRSRPRYFDESLDLGCGQPFKAFRSVAEAEDAYWAGWRAELVRLTLACNGNAGTCWAFDQWEPPGSPVRALNDAAGAMYAARGDEGAYAAAEAEFTRLAAPLRAEFGV